MAGMSYNSNTSDLLLYLPLCDLGGCIWQLGPLLEGSRTFDPMHQAPLTSPQNIDAKLRVQGGLRLEHKELAASVLQTHLSRVSKKGSRSTPQAQQNEELSFSYQGAQSFPQQSKHGTSCFVGPVSYSPTGCLQGRLCSSQR